MTPLLPKESLLTPEAKERLLNALLGNASTQGISVNRVDGAVPGNAWYSPTEKLITLGGKGSDSELSSLAHELGHAEFGQTALGDIVQSRAARGIAGKAWLIGGLIGAVAEGSFARRFALSGGVAAAMQAPLLTGEAVASIKGHTMLKNYGAPESLLDLHNRQMLRGFSSYLRPGAIGVAGALAGSALGATTSK